MRWLLTFTLTGFAAFLVAALATSIILRGAQPSLPVKADARDVYVRDIDCGSGRYVPAPFVCEDRLDQGKLDIGDRVVWWQSPLLDGEISYAYHHGNGPLITAALPADAEDPNYKMLDGADLINKILLMSLGIIIVAKGRDPRLAYPAGIFLYGMAAGTGIISTLVGLPWWLIILVQSLRQVLLGMSLFGLFFLSTELAKRAIPDAMRKTLNIGAGVFILAVIAVLLLGSVVFPLEVYQPPWPFVKAFYGLPVLAKIIPLLVMAYALAREDAEDPMLLRWIFASTLIGFSGPLIKETSSALGAGNWRFGPLVLTESVMAFGYGYSLIKSRLVDVNFVLNRAAVLAVLAGIVAVGFELGSTLLQAKYEHSGEVAYALVLLLGISLNYLRPKLEALFRRLASAHRVGFEEGLMSLIKDCRRMKNVDDVFAVTVNQLRHLAGASTCALYERQNGGFVRVALDESAPSASAFPLHLSDDDQVILRMESTRLGTDAQSVGGSLVTAMPPTSTSFPMLVSDELIGVIAMEPAQEQQLRDPDVRHDLRTFARELGNILAFKRSQYCEGTIAEAPAVSRLSPA